MNVIHEKKRFDWTAKKMTECYQQKKFVSNDLRSYVIWLNNNRAENEKFELKSKIFQHQNWEKYRRINIILFSLFSASKRKRERSSASQQSKQSKHQNENQSKQQTKRQRQQKKNSINKSNFSNFECSRPSNNHFHLMKFQFHFEFFQYLQNFTFWKH